MYVLRGFANTSGGKSFLQVTPCKHEVCLCACSVHETFKVVAAVLVQGLWL